MLCQVLGVSRSGFYAWRARQRQPESERTQQDCLLMTEIKASHQASRGTYGAPRILDDLRDRGHRTSRKRVQRLMRMAGVRGVRPRRYVRTTDSDHRFVITENVLSREFTASSADCKWACDITYVPTEEGWLYLAVVMDLFSRRIVGHATSSSLGCLLVEEALSTALARRSPAPGLIHHSDRGSQYASTAYQELLHGAEIVCSMSRRGNCWDNAPVESFFATLKAELVYRHRYRTRAQARSELFEYIEVFYNAKRKHSALGYLSPIAFERKQQHALPLAA